MSLLESVFNGSLLLPVSKQRASCSEGSLLFPGIPTSSLSSSRPAVTEEEPEVVVVLEEDTGPAFDNSSSGQRVRSERFEDFRV